MKSAEGLLLSSVDSSDVTANFVTRTACKHGTTPAGEVQKEQIRYQYRALSHEHKPKDLAALLWPNVALFQYAL